MARFAIIRQDGEVDKVDGSSVDDIANRYGWPGNGSIEPWEDGAHNEHLRHTFGSPEEQREALADKPKGKAAKAAADDAKGDTDGDDPTPFKKGS